MSEPIKRELNIKNHKFLFGAGVTQFLEEIGRDIDFVVLDTVHVTPGEILDFLAILPYLKSDAVVCLHDVSLCQRGPEFRPSIATGLLFSSVMADKIINLIPDDGNIKFLYPNIGAFQINQDTMKNIMNVVMTLVLPWSYIPPNVELKKYSAFIRHYYNDDIFKIFNEAVKMNLYSLIMASYN